MPKACFEFTDNVFDCSNKKNILFELWEIKQKMLILANIPLADYTQFIIVNRKIMSLSFEAQKVIKDNEG